MTKVSVIIPFHNVEKYFEKCINSLFNQTLQEIEFIFVNDFSNDRSEEILFNMLSKRPYLKDKVKIIPNNYEKGVANARLSGIKASKGDYLIHCDADDYIEPQMYSVMYGEAIRTGADITICDFILEEDNISLIYKTGKYDTPHAMLLNWYKENNTFPSLCNKLVKRNLIFDNSIFPFPNCNYGEDFGCVVRFLYYAKSLTFVNQLFYHYNKHQGSLTTTPLTKEKFYERVEITNRIIPIFKEKKFKNFKNILKMNIKLKGKGLFKHNLDEWFDLYQECHKYIPYLTNESIKSRILWSILLFNRVSFKLFLKNKRLLNFLNE